MSQSCCDHCDRCVAAHHPPSERLHHGCSPCKAKQWRMASPARHELPSYPSALRASASSCGLATLCPSSWQLLHRFFSSLLLACLKYISSLLQGHYDDRPPPPKLIGSWGARGQLRRRREALASHPLDATPALSCAAACKSSHHSPLSSPAQLAPMLTVGKFAPFAAHSCKCLACAVASHQ